MHNVCSRLLIVAGFTFLTSSVHAAEPPPELVEAAEQAIAQCSERGGKANILPGYQSEADLNGDGQTDFVTDLGQMECVGAWQAFCHSTGCPVTVWLSGPGGGYTRFPLGDLKSFEVSETNGEFPVFSAHYDSALCDAESPGATVCTRSWVFETNNPETPDFDMPEATAPEPPQADEEESIEIVAVSPGWTLRQVQGARPLALGGGVGGIASLSGFCILDRPFLAVRFLEQPQSATVNLGFAFPSGAIEAEATYEDTAGGAFIIDLKDQPLAARLAGLDSRVAVSVNGGEEGILSLRGSTRTLRAALAECYDF